MAFPETEDLLRLLRDLYEAQQAMAFLLWPGREGDIAVRDRIERPKSIDRDGTVLCAQRADVGACARIECIDPSVAEIADEQIAREPTEARPGDSHPPTRIES